MAEVFGEKYAGVYDQLYREKDYERECDFLEELFADAPVPVHRILDLGCGTAGHAVPLARRGYEITGVDRSETMLDSARLKSSAADVPVEFVQGDIRTVQIDRNYDAVIAMFAVMGYQTTNEDLASVCRSAARHLVPGGLFVFDAWYGPAVLANPPACRVKTVNDGAHQVIRFTQPRLDAENHIAQIVFTVWEVRGDRQISCTTETHVMRFLFPKEVAYFLRVAGFGDTALCPFLGSGRPLDNSCWNMAVRSVRE